MTKLVPECTLIVTGWNESWVTQQKSIATPGKVIQRTHLWTHGWSSSNGYVLGFRSQNCVHIGTHVLRVRCDQWWYPRIYSQHSTVAFWTPTTLSSFQVGMHWCSMNNSGIAASVWLLFWLYPGGKQGYTIDPSMLAYSIGCFSKLTFLRRLRRNAHNATFFFLRKGLLPVTHWWLWKSPWGLPGNMPLSGEDTDRKRQWLAFSCLWGQACSAEKERTDSSNWILLLKQTWVWEVLGLSVRTSENKRGHKALADHWCHSPSECRTNVHILLPPGSFL